MINIKNLNLAVTELCIKGTKLNISIVFTTQSHFRVTKDVRLDSTHFYYENSKQKRTSKGCNKLLIRY